MENFNNLDLKELDLEEQKLTDGGFICTTTAAAYAAGVLIGVAIMSYINRCK